MVQECTVLSIESEKASKYLFKIPVYNFLLFNFLTFVLYLEIVKSSSVGGLTG